MSYNTPDVYYQPDKFGLTVVHEIDDPNASYSFDMLVLWRHADGRLFYASDAGCSCPSPFEDYTSLDDLTELTDDSFAAFEGALATWCSWQKNDEETALRRHEMYMAAAKALGGAS